MALSTNQPRDLIALRELADLLVGNPARTDLAARRCFQRRVPLIERYRGRVGDKTLEFYVAAEDVPRLFGSDHVVMRNPLGWRDELDRLRRRKTRALKRQAARNSRDVQLHAHLSCVEREVESALASRRSWARRAAKASA